MNPHFSLVGQRLPVAAFVALALSSWAAAQSAYGIQVPIRSGGAVEISAPEAVSEPLLDVETGLVSISAASLSDAAAAASSCLASGAQPEGPAALPEGIKRIDGACSFVSSEGGYGIMVVGRGLYREAAANPDAVRISRRKAYTAAYLDALRGLTEKVFGADVRQKERILNRMESLVTDDATGTRLETAGEESVNSRISGFLRGAQIYSCEDSGGEVTVKLFLTAESANAARTVGLGSVIASPGGMVQAIDRVMDEVVNGFVPPVGSKTIVDPVSGTIAFIGFGSAIVRSAESPRLARANELQARRAAQLRATGALVGALTGQEVSAESALDATSADIETEWKSASNALPPTEGEDAIFAASCDALRERLSTSDAMEAAVSGRLPPNTQDGGILDEKSGWLTWYYVYIPGAEMFTEALKGTGRKGPGAGAGTGTGARPAPKFDPARRGPSGGGRDPRSGGGGR